MSENSLITTYLRNIPLETLEKQEFLYKLFQLLSYIQTIESSINWISNENYRILSFRVSEFLEFILNTHYSYIIKEKIMFEEVPKNCTYTYARVSSKPQEDNSSLEAQKEEFLRLGVPVKNIRVEVGSAADKIEDRPIFYHLINDELKENDLLLVAKIDRCSRNTLEFLKLQERLHKKGVTFLSLDLPYSIDISVNKLIATNLAAIATFENERRKERQRQGIQAAKKNGKYLGRRTVIDKKLISQVQDLKETKNLSITEISKITGRARNTIYKILKNELNYVPYNRLVKQEKIDE
jgi:DNA invertase Pin-like site-specific DNA recombinase